MTIEIEPPLPLRYSSIKGVVINLQRDVLVDPPHIDQYTVESKSKATRISLRPVVITRKVEVLWKTAYYLVHPHIEYATPITEENFVKLIKMTAEELTDRGNKIQSSHIYDRHT